MWTRFRHRVASRLDEIKRRQKTPHLPQVNKSTQFPHELYFLSQTSSGEERLNRLSRVKRASEARRCSSHVNFFFHSGTKPAFRLSSGGRYDGRRTGNNYDQPVNR
jgi:hypothetical protein